MSDGPGLHRASPIFRNHEGRNLRHADSEATLYVYRLAVNKIQLQINLG